MSTPDDASPSPGLELARATTAASVALPAAPSRHVELASGRSLAIVEQDGASYVAFFSPAGQPLLTVRLDDDGPMLSFPRASIEVAAIDRLDLVAESLAIAAEKDVTIEVGGDLRERVGGAVIRQSGGTATTRARDVTIEAFPGGASVTAHEDVRLAGERVRLNSEDPPMPLSWDEFHARRVREVPALLDGPLSLPPTSEDDP